MVLTLSSNWLLRGCVQAAVGTGFCHAIHLLSWSVPRVRECPAVTHARANTSHATRSCCERQGHLQTHDAVEHLIKKLHHIITEVTSKASIWKADYFYHLLEVANENLLWIFSPNLLPRRRLNGLRNLPKVDIKKKKKMRGRVGVDARVQTCRLWRWLLHLLSFQEHKKRILLLFLYCSMSQKCQCFQETIPNSSALKTAQTQD